MGIIQFPSEFSTSFNPIVYIFQSERVPQIQDLNATLTVTITEDDNGIQMSINAQSKKLLKQLAVGDYIFFEESSIYKGYKKITSIISAFEFILDATFVGSEKNIKAQFGYFNHSVKIEVVGKKGVIGSKTQRAEITESGQKQKGRFVFDVSPIIRTDIARSNLPFFDEKLGIFPNRPFSNPAIYKTYVIGISESWTQGSGIVTRSVTAQSIKRGGRLKVIPAALQYKDRQTLDEFASDLGGTERIRFLTNQFGSTSGTTVNVNAPNRKTIGELDDEWLYFIKRIKTTGKVYRRIRFFEADGTLADFTTINEAHLITTNGLIVIPVGTNQITFPEYGGPVVSTAATYKVDLIRGADILSETVTYVIDRDCKNTSKCFHWLNPYGVIDSFTFTGEEINSIDVSRTAVRGQLNIIDKNRNVNNTKQLQRDFLMETQPDGDIRIKADREWRTTEMNINELFQTNTGHISQSQGEWLKEFFMSPEQYIQDSYFQPQRSLTRQRFLPIRVNTRSITYRDTRNDLLSISFEYTYDFDRVVQV